MYKFSVSIGGVTTTFSFPSGKQEDPNPPTISGSIRDADVILTGMVNTVNPFGFFISYPPSPEEMHYYLSQLQEAGALSFSQTGVLTVEEYPSAPPGIIY